MLVSAIASNAATVSIYNAANGGGDPQNSVPADTLYALSDNSLMVGGIVTVGYFSASTVSADIDTIEELVPLLGSFTVITSRAPGTTPVNSLGSGGPLPGYADQFLDGDGTQIVGSPAGLINEFPLNTLFNRDIYAIVTNAVSLNPGDATLSSEFGVFFVGKLTGDSPLEVGLVVNPNANAGALIGTFDTKVGDFSEAGFESEYNTYKLATIIPEPSALLLSAFGALGLLRRRR